MKHLRNASLAFCILLLAACDVSTPSQVSVRQLQLKEAVKTQTLDAWRVDPNHVNIIADAYLRNGRGPLSLTLSHLPSEASSIRQQGAIYKRVFEKQGVRSMKIDYVSMDSPDNAGKAVVAYRALTAQPPEGCGRIPGHQGSENLQAMEQYTVGCETQAAMARQIAHPADLLGKAGTPDEDSKRLGTMVDPYRAGVRNPKMEGMNASEISDDQSGGGGGG